MIKASLLVPFTLNTNNTPFKRLGNSSIHLKHVVQLTAWSLPKSEDPGSNLDIGKFCSTSFTANCTFGKNENQEKESGVWVELQNCDSLRMQWSANAGHTCKASGSNPCCFCAEMNRR